MYNEGVERCVQAFGRETLKKYPQRRSKRRWENNIKMNQSFIYSPTDALVSCLKNNIKIYIRTAPTCFGAVAPSSGSELILAY